MIAECRCLLLWYAGIEIMCIYKYGSVVSLSFSSLLMFLRAYFRDSRIVVYMVRGWHSVCGCNSVSPQAMSFEAHSLTVPSVMWLGLLPSDLQRFGLNLPYFLHPSAPNWNDYIPGNCLFWFLLLLPCFFPLHWASSEAILIFKYKLWLWRFYDVCLIVVYTGLLLCLLLNIHTTAPQCGWNQCRMFQVACPTERSSPPHQERWRQTSQPSQKAILNQATRVEERGERKQPTLSSFHLCEKLKNYKIYINKTCNVNMLLWQMELIQQTKVKAEIQSLSAIAPDFLTNIYLPNKLRYKGWVWVRCRHLVEKRWTAEIGHKI